MIQKADKVGFDDRVVDYSDPAQLPHPPRPRVQRKDTGGFVAAGVAAGMLIVGGFAYVGYLDGKRQFRAMHDGRVQAPAIFGHGRPRQVVRRGSQRLVSVRRRSRNLTERRQSLKKLRNISPLVSLLPHSLPERGRTNDRTTERAS